MKKPTIVIASAVVVALAFGGGAYYYKAQQAQEISKLAGAEESVFVRAASPSLGCGIRHSPARGVLRSGLRGLPDDVSLRQVADARQ
jgi:hypothetical protein